MLRTILTNVYVHSARAVGDELLMFLHSSESICDGNLVNCVYLYKLFSFFFMPVTAVLLKYVVASYDTLCCSSSFGLLCAAESF